MLASAAYDETVRLWDVQSGQMISRAEGSQRLGQFGCILCGPLHPFYLLSAAGPADSNSPGKRDGFPREEVGLKTNTPGVKRSMMQCLKRRGSNHANNLLAALREKFATSKSSAE